MAESVRVLFHVSIDLDLANIQPSWLSSLVSNAFVFWLYEGRVDNMSYLILF